MKARIQDLFETFNEIRYVAIDKDKQLIQQQRDKILTGASSEESDKYEELLVNPVLLKLAEQRGEIDCGGLGYILIRYGNFIQMITSINGGHLSICLDKNADVINLPEKILARW